MELDAASATATTGHRSGCVASGADQSAIFRGKPFLFGVAKSVDIQLTGGSYDQYSS